MAACLRASTPVGPRDCTTLAAKGQHPRGSKGLHCPGSHGPAPLWVQGTPPPWQSRDSTPVGPRDCTALAVERPLPPCGFLKWQHWQSRASTPVGPRDCTALAVTGQHPCGSKGLHCLGSQGPAPLWVQETALHWQSKDQCLCVGSHRQDGCRVLRFLGHFIHSSRCWDVRHKDVQVILEKWHHLPVVLALGTAHHQWKACVSCITGQDLRK